MTTSPFVLNNIYKRSSLHDEFGGSRRGGIAVSARFPYIFIFSGDTGHQHGYKDQWENENVFSYTGEGQTGDMRFIKGNLALREHMKSGRRIFMFSSNGKAFVKFEGELELVEFGFFEGPDREGNERVSIKFFFKRFGAVINYEADAIISGILEEPESQYTRSPSITEREGLVTSRVGQGAYRRSILFRWNFKCAVTNYSRNEILIASHIVPWKDSTNQERLDRNNGILLSPTYDALFDRRRRLGTRIPLAR